MSSNPEKPKIRVENISCIIPETEKLGGVFLGNTYGAENPQILKQYGIRAVLTTSIQTPINYNPIDIPFHLKIQAHDKKDYEIIQHLVQCLDFIHKYRHLTNVYIHCYAGVSRSVTILIAYIMNYWKWPLKKTLEFVQSKRIVAKPNDGFMDQLKKFEQTLFSNRPSNRPPPILHPTTQPLNINHQNLQNGYNQYNHPPIEKLELKRFESQQLTTPMALTKRHSETPIPKILTKQGQRKQQGYTSFQVQNKHYHSNSTNHANFKTIAIGQGNTINLNSVSQNSKVQKQSIKPKDLPGYRN